MTAPNYGTPTSPEVRRALGVDNYNFVHRYPSDLGTKAGLMNYTVFYINVRNRDLDTISERYSGGGYVDPPAERNKQNRIKAEEETVVQGRKALSTLGVMAVGYGAANAVTGGGDSGRMLGIGTALAAGFAESKTGVAENFVFNDANAKSMQVVQISKVIALPLTTRPSATYSAGWVDFDTGIIGGAVQSGALGDIIKIPTDLANSLKEGSGTTPTAVLEAAVNNPNLQNAGRALLYKKMNSADILGAGLGETIEKATQRTPNPFKEQLFKSMGFRTFTFAYTFLPKSRKEALEVKAIIDTFKYFMHPGLTDQNFFLTYPAEFDIKYFYDGKENNFLHKISSCALTNLAVDYGSGSDFIAFRPDSSGAEYGIPTEISLQLQFTELELLSKQRIQDGF